jgi:hypothetical protein
MAALPQVPSQLQSKSPLPPVSTLRLAGLEAQVARSTFMTDGGGVAARGSPKVGPSSPGSPARAGRRLSPLRRGMEAPLATAAASPAGPASPVQFPSVSPLEEEGEELEVPTVGGVPMTAEEAIAYFAGSQPGGACRPTLTRQC